MLLSTLSCLTVCSGYCLEAYPALDSCLQIVFDLTVCPSANVLFVLSCLYTCASSPVESLLMLKPEDDCNVKTLVITDHRQMQDALMIHAARLRLAQRNGHTAHGHLQHFSRLDQPVLLFT